MANMGKISQVIGPVVDVTFEKLTDEITLPQFRLAERA